MREWPGSSGLAASAFSVAGIESGIAPGGTGWSTSACCAGGGGAIEMGAGRAGATGTTGAAGATTGAGGAGAGVVGNAASC